MKKLLLPLLLFPLLALAQQPAPNPEIEKLSTTEIEAALFRLRIQADRINAQLQQYAQVWEERIKQEQGKEGKKSRKND